MIKLNYMVSGTGRNGTVYMARLLTSLGINCCHEAIFNYEGLDRAIKVISGKLPLETSHCSTHEIGNQEKAIPTWLDINKVEAESSYLAAPFLGNALFKKTKIIHSVRNPLLVISSHVKDINFFDFTNVKFKPWTDFIIKHLPELNEIDNEIERACYYYVNWNKMVEKHAHIRHKVENQCSDDLLNFLNVDRPENVFDNTKINSWNKRNSDITFGDIPNGSIKKDLIEMAKKYEYRITPIKMI